MGSSDETVRIIAICLCDNDYGDTFRPLLVSVNQLLKWNTCATRESVERFIRDLIPAYYVAFQSSCKTSWPRLAQDDDTACRYLLDKVSIIFNEEAEHVVTTMDHDHGSWYLIACNDEIDSF